MEVMQGEVTSERMCQQFGGHTPENETSCFPTLSIPIPPIHAQRDTIQTAQASVIFASSSYLYYGKAVEDFSFFILTFHTVNQARLSNGNSD